MSWLQAAQERGKQVAEMRTRTGWTLGFPSVVTAKKWTRAGRDTGGRQPGLLALQMGREGLTGQVTCPRQHTSEQLAHLLLTLSVILLLIPRSISILSHSVTPIA